MTLLRIALRNVVKNRRRSLMTVLAIAFGYMAVGMFRGYTHNSYEKIALGAVFLEAPGHLVVFKKGFLEEGKLDPAKYLFSAADVSKIEGVLRVDPDVLWTAPKLALSGLITNGQTSTIFLADAVDPAEEQELWTHFRSPRPFRHQVLPKEPAFAAFLAPQLARLLKIEAGGTAVLMGTTRDGQMNAVDIEVAGITPAMSDAMDDKFIRIPLALAQSLYDFDGADRICVLLRNKDDTASAQMRLERLLKESGYSVDVKTWADLSLYYQKVKGFLDVVFLFLFTIVLIIVVMGTFNTMSMAVFERTREIGTLRAIGLKPAGVIRLFAAEGAILGMAGSLLGAFFTMAGFLILRWANLTYKPPGIADDVAVEIDLVPRVAVLSLVFFVGLAVFSAALPARRASRQNIVDALGHV